MSRPVTARGQERKPATEAASVWEQIERASSLSVKTYTRLKQIIITCELQPGEPLNEIDLARRFGISRSPLREATRQLQEEGLVEPAGRGLRVTPITRKGVWELYELRLALESFAASRATGRISLDSVESARIDLEKALRPLTRGDVWPFTNLDFQFHDLYVRSSGNDLLIDRVQRLRDHLRRIWRHVGIRADHTKLAAKEHFEILEAMSASGQSGLRDAVEKHVGAVGRRVASCVADEPS